ncbi:hypothetical protein AB0A66_31345 [Streptomyces longwoodensis]|uniref:hypothetical protein n=1 Tax=Streptomyces longwoodensis TaxID=68231 RepID=UPI0033CEB45C
MNDVVAVALITAVSTVAAGGLAAAFSYKAALTQTRSQREQAREGLIEERAVRHREVRRDVYVRFLNQLLDAHHFIDQLWMEPLPSPAEPALRQLTEHVDQLWKTMHIIELEGPPDVAEVARSMAGLAYEEWDALKEYLEGSHGGEELHIRASGDWAQFVRRRAEKREQLVERARRAVGGHLTAPD